ncbi:MULTISPECIES: hypothetical protein [unclassified Ruminococcus]|uniref:hypothetical protein n=1 Tax=unclassified Ruminococcus TaxID=2608920 RepID=UPI000AF797C3|nr:MULTISPECIES: hypothetical protein [unclassified Ruminococcus]
MKKHSVSAAGSRTCSSCSPVQGDAVLFVICQVLGKGLTALTGEQIFRHIFAGGESWGIAFMLLSVACVCGRDKEERL